MADKEATVYIVDVGKSMGRPHLGRSETDLDWCMKYIWDKIASTIATGRKTACAGVLGFRTDGTTNDLAGDEGYEHISVLQPLGQFLMPNVRDLRAQIRPSDTDTGDAISAIVIAIKMIEDFCKKLKWIRKIVLVTNGTGFMDGDQLDDITAKILQEGISLVVLGVDFDDPEYGFKEEEKSSIKASNENVLKTLVESCHGVYGTLAHAISELEIPRIKMVKPIASYKGNLTLGEPEQFDSALVLDVERYPKVMIAKPPTASSFVEKSAQVQENEGTTSLQNGDGNHLQPESLSIVHNDRTYQVDDPSVPGGKRSVDYDTLAKGYEYGRTAVHISESDLNVTQLESQASLEIVGFIPWENYDRYMSMSNTHMIIAQRTNDKAKMALSALIRALFELQDFAIARFVTKDMKEPKLVVLAPCIEPDFECLIDCEIPFAEDVRSYKFPPLDRIVTVSGNVLTEHRNLPNKTLQRAMSDYVDAMDLSTLGKNDDGLEMEYLPMDETFSPIVHRINQAIRHRATRPADPIPPVDTILIAPSRVPSELISVAAAEFESLHSAADVKKVPPKALSRKGRYGREKEQPRSGLDVSGLLSSRTAANQNKISPDNAIPEFKQLVANAQDIDTIKDAVAQLGDIIEDSIKHSVGDRAYDRAVEGISVMRKECFELEEPGIFNEFMRHFKMHLLDEQLGGDRRELWWKIRSSRVGLIEKKISPTSDVDEEEAKTFLLAR